MRHYFPKLSNQRYSHFDLEVAAAKRSLYYWWWRYLRLSEDYWWLCQQKGRTSDKEFAKTFKIFGNVFGVSFAQWWDERGAKVFAYKVDPPKVEKFKFKDIHFIHTEKWMQPVMIPLHLTKTEILAQINALFQEHVPEPLPESVTTDNQVEELRGIRKQVLIDAHRVWCLNDLVMRGKNAGTLDRPERLTQLWIGEQLGLEPEPDKAKVIRPLQTEKYERLATRVKVNRYLVKAQNIIANVEIGHFPLMRKVPARARWSVKQLAEKTEAIAAGQWISPEADTKEFNSFLPLKKKSIATRNKAKEISVQ